MEGLESELLDQKSQFKLWFAKPVSPVVKSNALSLSPPVDCSTGLTHALPAGRPVGMLIELAAS